MSQIIKGVTAGSLPPSVPTSFVTDSGTVIPASNIVNINSGSTSSNNANGISVIANPTTSNNELIQLTNRISGSATTTDAATQTLVFSFPLGIVPANYQFEVSVSALDKTDNLGATYKFIFPLRTTGTTPFTYGLTTPIQNEEGAMSGVIVALQGVSSDNTLKLRVNGLAGKTIDWVAVGTYVQATQ